MSRKSFNLEKKLLKKYQYTFVLDIYRFRYLNPLGGIDQHCADNVGAVAFETSTEAADDGAKVDVLFVADNGELQFVVTP